MSETYFALPAGTTTGGFEENLLEQTWARLAMLVGTEVDWLRPVTPTPVSGQRATNLPAFEFAAGGFYVKTTQAVQVPHEPITSGQRWDFIGIRLDWTPAAANGGGNAQGVVITGGTTAVLPASRQTVLGQVYDVPVALVLLDSASATPKSVIPLYKVAGKPLTVASMLAVPAPTLGQIVQEGGAVWRWSGSAWIPLAPPVQVTTTLIPAGSSQVKNRTDVAVVTKTVTDPGYPYRLRLGGNVDIGTSPDITVRLSTMVNGSAVAYTYVPANNMGGDQSARWIPPRTSPTVYSGPTTATITGRTWVYTPNPSVPALQADSWVVNGGWLDVEVIPA